MDDDADMPPPGPKQLPPRSGNGAPKLPTGSTATNGYWLHGDAGPSVLVDSVSGPLSRLETSLSAKFPQLRFSIENGAICVEDTVHTQVQLAEVCRLIEQIKPTMSVVTRFVERGRDKDE